MRVRSAVYKKQLGGSLRPGLEKGLQDSGEWRVLDSDREERRES